MNKSIKVGDHKNGTIRITIKRGIILKTIRPIIGTGHPYASTGVVSHYKSGEAAQITGRSCDDDWAVAMSKTSARMMRAAVGWHK